MIGDHTDCSITNLWRVSVYLSHNDNSILSRLGVSTIPGAYHGLKKRWSPAEIHARLIIDFPNDLEMRVSHETIYTSLYLQAKGGLKKELISALRSGRLRRRLRKRGESARRSILADIVPISDRPPQAADRAFPGHWESQCCCQATVSAVRMGSW